MIFEAGALDIPNLQFTFEGQCCVHLRVFRSKTCGLTPEKRVNAPKIMKIVQKRGKTHDFHEKKRKNRLFSGGGQKTFTRLSE